MIACGSTLSKYAVGGELKARRSGGGGTAVIELGRTDKVAKMVPNPRCMTAVEGKENTFAVDLSKLPEDGSPFTILKYALVPTFRPMPLKVVAQWAVKPTVAAVNISYIINPSLGCDLTDVRLLVPIKGASQSRRMLFQPQGLWSEDAGKVLWKVDRVAAKSAAAKLAAKVETGEESVPAPVAVKFACHGASLSGLAVRAADAAATALDFSSSFLSGAVAFEPK